jgi:hypothetical protein
MMLDTKYSFDNLWYKIVIQWFFSRKYSCNSSYQLNVWDWLSNIKCSLDNLWYKISHLMILDTKHSLNDFLCKILRSNLQYKILESSFNIKYSFNDLSTQNIPPMILHAKYFWVNLSTQNIFDSTFQYKIFLQWFFMQNIFESIFNIKYSFDDLSI